MPRNTEIPHIVEADFPARRKRSNTVVLWGAVLVVIVVLFAVLMGNAAPPAKQTPAKPAQRPVVAATCVNFTLACKPSISAKMIENVLAHYTSPAAGEGQVLYTLGVQYGIDPAYALAFFMNESSFGTSGMATVTMGLGNERCLQDRACVNQQGLPCLQGQSCYAQFTSWSDGFAHWFQLILYGYIQGGINKAIGRKACPCRSVPQIIPIYAPGSDNNDEAHYIWVVEHAVSTWRSGNVVVP